MSFFFITDLIFSVWMSVDEPAVCFSSHLCIFPALLSFSGLSNRDLTDSLSPTHCKGDSTVLSLSPHVLQSSLNHKVYFR